MIWQSPNMACYRAILDPLSWWLYNFLLSWSWLILGHRLELSWSPLSKLSSHCCWFVDNVYKILDSCSCVFWHLDWVYQMVLWKELDMLSVQYRFFLSIRNHARASSTVNAAGFGLHYCLFTCILLHNIIKCKGWPFTLRYPSYVHTKLCAFFEDLNCCWDAFSFDYMHVYMHVVKWLFSHFWWSLLFFGELRGYKRHATFYCFCIILCHVAFKTFIFCKL